MDVQWTWRLVGQLAGVLFLSGCSAYGAGMLALGLGLGSDLAALVALAVFLSNFFIADRAFPR